MRVARPRSEFELKNGESEVIVNLRYKHHLNRMRELLNEVIAERKGLGNPLFLISHEAGKENNYGESPRSLSSNRHQITTNKVTFVSLMSTRSQSVKNFGRASLKSSQLDESDRSIIEQQYMQRREKLFRDLNVKLKNFKTTEDLVKKQTLR